MGCVTWLANAILPIVIWGRKILMLAEKRHAKCYARLPMNYGITAGKVCVGASGTVQALQEIMMAQGMDETHYPGKVAAIETARAIHCGRLEEIDGLMLERALVFPSGLAILIAILPN
ncbi:hypothetical protein ACNKHU_23795 [Shigella flexneri]